MRRGDSIYERPILAALIDGPMTCPQMLAAIRFGTRQGIAHGVKRLKARDLVHIVGYETVDRGPRKPIWAAGAGEDAPYPGPRTAAEDAARVAAYRKRLKRDDWLKWKAQQVRKNAKRRQQPAQRDIAAQWIS